MDARHEVPTQEPASQLPARHAVERLVAAILSSPVLEQPTVLPTKPDGSYIMLDGSFPPPGLSHAIQNDRRSRWAERLADDSVADDAYFVACWLMQRRAPCAGIKQQIVTTPVAK